MLIGGAMNRNHTSGGTLCVVLPTIEEFDAHLAEPVGTLARLERANRQAEMVTGLLDRAGRARCLAMLQLYEELREQGKRSRYNEIAHVTGLSVSRVQQLLADARVWREMEARGID